ncbi:uncharacterized protein LOC113455526 isoform X2 [Microtus ochrogaster]|uniref:Uncharacterized protein LOC113455526 isoform X2 n=1 Tax=Microtus ochrogaster TaxID=79684 RepID=A0ABM1TTT5_MICOH|nr:uncharacterized protein LOC113455526 isoform X2 [Microtus ochrogaster]
MSGSTASMVVVAAVTTAHRALATMPPAPHATTAATRPKPAAACHLSPLATGFFGPGRRVVVPAAEHPEQNIARPHSLHSQELSFMVKHPVQLGIQPEETQNSFLGLKKPKSPFQS